MRLATKDEIARIGRMQCPCCSSENVDERTMKMSCDGYCNECDASWSQYKDGKVILWKVGT